MSDEFEDQPIIIIGAPRSGTKFFRETLRLHPDIVGPKYEIEDVWCHGNMHRYNMSLEVEDIKPQTVSHIHGYFGKWKEKNPGKRVLVKSTLLPLRIGFIRKIFPDAPILHIVRDGRDASCSIRDRYIQPLELAYMLKHRIFPPLREVPYYFKYWLKNTYASMISKKKKIKQWGPQFDDMAELHEKYSLLEVCGIQWNRSVMSIVENRKLLESGPFLEIRYEDLCKNSEPTVKGVIGFLRMDGDGKTVLDMISLASKGSVGRWRNELSEKDMDLLMPHIHDGLLSLGYLEPNEAT